MAIVIWAIGLYLLIFATSLILFTALIVMLPARYFVEQPNWLLQARTPLVRWTGIIGKNLLGIVLVILGVILSVPGIPGQGLVTIAIGVALLDVPGRRRLVRWLAFRPRVLRSINRLRSWFGRPPLIIVPPPASDR